MTRRSDLSDLSHQEEVRCREQNDEFTGNGFSVLDAHLPNQLPVSHNQVRLFNTLQHCPFPDIILFCTKTVRPSNAGVPFLEHGHFKKRVRVHSLIH